MERQEEIDYLVQTIADFIAISADNSKKARELQTISFELQKTSDYTRFGIEKQRIKEDKQRIKAWIEFLAENTAFLMKMILNMQERLEHINRIDRHKSTSGEPNE